MDFLSGLSAFLPSDLLSFVWGAALTAAAVFSTSFLQKAGEAAFAYFKSVPSEHDKTLFVLFQSEVAAEPTLRLFKVPDFDDSFRRSDLRPLNTFVEAWGGVEKEFLDSKLEAAKQKLHTSAEKLATEIARLTVPVGDGTFASVYSDAARSEHGVDERPAWVRAQAKILNAAAKPFAVEYEKFVRLCRKRLKV